MPIEPIEDTLIEGPYSYRSDIPILDSLWFDRDRAIVLPLQGDVQPIVYRGTSLWHVAPYHRLDLDGRGKFAQNAPVTLLAVTGMGFTEELAGQDWKALLKAVPILGDTRRLRQSTYVAELFNYVGGNEGTGYLAAILALPASE